MQFELVNVKDRTLDELIKAYETIMSTVIYTKYTDANVAGMCETKLLTWLRSTDFYKAPASTRFHESVVGGLLVHTLNVYNNVISLLNAPQFAQCDATSAAFIALVHDWCKINYYEPYERNVKNEETGQWEKQTAFRTNQTGVPLGHGVSSMFLAAKFFRLTPEEALAIRWHMGPWRVVDSEMNELQLASENYPLVHLIQFADSLSITNYANLY